MPISKKILGVTTLLLAAVGAFATATHQRNNTYFYISGSTGSPCKPIDVTFDCITGASGCTLTVGTGAQPKQLFHSKATGTNLCRTLLHT
jgi:hypothetical protein